MPRAFPIQASFAGGEVDPLLDVRSDLARWRVGLAACSNFTVLPQGGVARRSGTRHVAFAGNADGRTRLVPFAPTTDNAFVVELGDQRARFLSPAGLVLFDNGMPRFAPMPWRADDLRQLAWAQAGDTLYFAHPNYPPHTLRFVGGMFVAAPLDLAGHPMRAENATDITLTAGAVSGFTTLLASRAFFEAGHVGAVFRLSEPTGVLPYLTWRPDMTVQTNMAVQYGGRVYQAMHDGNAGMTPPVHDQGDVYSAGNATGGVTWRYLHDGRGTIRISEVASSTLARGVVLERLPGIAATRRWNEGAWSSARGWPAAVTLHQQRLWYAATRSDPVSLWASRTGQLRNFADGPDADDGIALDMAAPQVNAIRWLASGPALAAGTSGGVFLVTAFSADAPITPDSVRLTRATGEGAGAAAPVVAGDSLLYVARGGRRLVEFAESPDLAGWRGADATIAATHMLARGVDALAFAGEPAGTLWCATGGALAALTYARDQQVLAWHRHQTDGHVEDVAAIPAPDGGDDLVYLVVRREAGGVVRRRIELMAPAFRPTGEFERSGMLFLDAASSYDGTFPATLVPSGLSGTVTLATSADVFRATDVGRRLRAGVARATILAVGGPRSATAQVAIPFADLSSIPARSWSMDAGRLAGLDHLAGREIDLVLDGLPAGRARVEANGEVALPRRAWTADAGLGFTSILESLPFDAGMFGGSALGRTKRVARILVHLHRSEGGSAEAGGGRPQTLVEPMTLPGDAPPRWFTGPVEIPLGGGFERVGRVRIAQSSPLPLTILGLAPVVQMTEG